MALLLCAGVFAQAAEAQGTLTPVKARITDEAIAKDYATFDGWRERLDTLPVSDAAIAIYARAKARAWLDFAEEEYTDDDRSALPAQALAEAAMLITALERGTVVAAAASVSFEGLTAQRSSGYADLAAEATTWRTDGTLARRPAELGVFEVELVRGERRESNATYCRPRPHQREAQRLAAILRSAQSVTVEVAEAMSAAPGVSEVSPVAQTTPTAPMPRADASAATASASAPSSITSAPASPVAAAPTIPTRVHFAFDRAFLSRPTRVVLDEILGALLADPSLLVALQGHTDTRGTAAYNVDLGRRRVRAVEAYLLAHGIARSRITSTATLGETQPGLEVRGDLRTTARNRRVALTLTDEAGRMVPGVAQETDMQLERARRRP